MSGIRSWTIEVFDGEPWLSCVLTALKAVSLVTLFFMAGGKLVVGDKNQMKGLKKSVFSLFKYKWLSDGSGTVMTCKAWGVLFSIVCVFPCCIGTFN